MTATDLDAAREHDRLALLDQLDAHHAAGRSVPCRTGDLHTTAAWTDDDDDVQAVAAAACRSLPCPAITSCRAYGIAWPREEGALGGLTQAQRRKAARQEAKAS